MSNGYYVVAQDLKAGSVNSRYKKFLSNGIAPPPVTGLRDTLSSTGFTVPVTSTVSVSGGGAALQTAVTAAGPGTRLLITDSLNYDGNLTISGKTNLTIQAQTGQTPQVTAAAGTGQSAIRIGAGNSGLHFIGLALIGNGNQNTLGQTDNGVLLGSPPTLMATVDRIIVENCTFNDLNPALGVPGIQFTGTDGTVHDNVQIVGCTFTDCATPAFATGADYGACTVGGFNHVWVQDCLIKRSVVTRAASNMRGVVMKNLVAVVEDVLCEDIGTGGSNENYKTPNVVLLGTAIGSTSIRNCMAVNAKRGFRIDLGGATMLVTDSEVFNNVVGIAAGQTFVRQSAGTMTFRDSIIEGAGDGTAFEAAVTEDHNDIFNVAAPGKVLDATDLTVDPLLTNTVLHDYRATAAGVVTGASDGGSMGVRYAGGTRIFWAGV